MDGQFGRCNDRLARRSSIAPSAAFPPTAFSWQRQTDSGIFRRYDPESHDSELLIRRNAVSAVDVIFALIEREIFKVRHLIPRVDLSEIGKQMATQLPYWWNKMLAYLAKLSGAEKQRSLAGKDALLDTDLLNLDRLAMADDMDDLDSISLGNSTVGTAAENKRLAELEAQLAELRSTVSILSNALQQRSNTQPQQVALSPPPDPTKNGSIPLINRNAPIPPPPPPFSMSNKAANPTNKPVIQHKEVEEEEEDEKENLPKSVKPNQTPGCDFMSVLTEALKKRRKMIGSGVSTSTFEELEMPKSISMSNGDHLLRAMREKVPPPEINESHDSDWFERDDEDWR